MRRYCLWALALALLLIPTAMSEGQKGSKTPAKHDGDYPGAFTADETGYIGKIYALGELGGDAGLARWVADTIPQVIEPDSWSQDGTGKQILTYDPTAKVLVVYHTPAVHAKIATFLDSLRKAVAQGNAPATNVKHAKAHGVVPAQYSEPDPMFKPAEPMAPTNPYPVPATKKQPKHLFHFIIRYEGEGIIDSNVIEFLKLRAAQDEQAAKVLSNSPFPPPSPGTVPACQPAPTGPTYVNPAQPAGTTPGASTAPSSPAASPPASGTDDAPKLNPASSSGSPPASSGQPCLKAPVTLPGPKLPGPTPVY
jgi:hypothetical protein